MCILLVRIDFVWIPAVMIRRLLSASPLVRNGRLVANVIRKLRELSIKAKPDHRPLFMPALKNCASDAPARKIAADQLALDAADIADLHAPRAEYGHRLGIDRVFGFGDEMHFLARMGPEDLRSAVRLILVRVVGADDNEGHLTHGKLGAALPRPPSYSGFGSARAASRAANAARALLAIAAGSFF